MAVIDNIKSFFTGAINFINLVKSALRWFLAKAIKQDITTDIDNVNFTPRTMWELVAIVVAGGFIIALVYILGRSLDNHQIALNQITRLEKTVKTLEQTVSKTSESNKRLEKEIEKLKLENELIIKLKAELIKDKK